MQISTGKTCKWDRPARPPRYTAQRTAHLERVYPPEYPVKQDNKALALATRDSPVADRLITGTRPVVTS